MATLAVWFWQALKLALVAAGAFYAVYVLVKYSTLGPEYRLELDSEDFIHRAQRILLWLGIKAVAVVLSIGKWAFNYFSEPSAEVGDWLISKSPRLQNVVARPRPR